MTPDYEPIGLKAAMEGRERDFPVLARALENMERATHNKVEWLVERESDEEPLRRVLEYNYCQIQRNPYEGGHRTEALTRHLEGIEITLVHGVRGEAPWLNPGPPSFTCGGTLDLLGREPADGDVLSLRVLTDLRHLNGPGRAPEFLTEFTLVAYPARLVEA